MRQHEVSEVSRSPFMVCFARIQKNVGDSHVVSKRSKSNSQPRSKAPSNGRPASRDLLGARQTYAEHPRREHAPIGKLREIFVCFYLSCIFVGRAYGPPFEFKRACTPGILYQQLGVSASSLNTCMPAVPWAAFGSLWAPRIRPISLVRCCRANAIYKPTRLYASGVTQR